jgi:class 3 adenylate cyclase
MGDGVDIEAWLRDLGLERYEQRFRESDIDTDILADLTDSDLAELGIAPEHRGELLEAIAELRTQAGAGAVEPILSPIVALDDAHAERRQLTILFCDLVGSAAPLAGGDPEDMRGVIHAYQHCCRSVIGRWDGHIAKLHGRARAGLLRLMSATQSWFGASTTMPLARSGKIG